MHPGYRQSKLLRTLQRRITQLATTNFTKPI